MNSSGQAHKTRKDLSMSRSRSFPTTKRNDRWSSSSPCVNEGLRPRNSETIVTVNKHDPESGLTLSLPDTEGAAENSLIRRTPMYKTPLPGQNLKWHLDEDLSIDWGALFYGTDQLLWGYLPLTSSSPLEHCRLTGCRLGASSSPERLHVFTPAGSAERYSSLCFILCHSLFRMGLPSVL